MSLFTLAWTMYRRTIGWLVLGALMAAFVEAVVQVGSVTLGLTGGFGLYRAGAGPIAAIATGMGAVVVGLLVSQIVVLVVHGGMIKLVIDSQRSGRPAEPIALFSGFPRIASYAGLWAIAYIGVPLAFFAVEFTAIRLFPLIVLLLSPFAFGIVVWIMVKWVFALPLIADRGVGPLSAISQSADLVRRSGWWTIFLRLVVLGIIVVVVEGVFSAVTRAGGAPGGAAGAVNVAVVEVLFVPIILCYITAMYLGATPRTATTGYGASPAWPGGPGYGSMDPGFGYDAAYAPAGYAPTGYASTSYAPTGYAPAPPAAAYPPAASYPPATPPAPPPGVAATPPPPPPSTRPVPGHTDMDRAWAAAADPLAKPPDT